MNVGSCAMMTSYFQGINDVSDSNKSPSSSRRTRLSLSGQEVERKPRIQVRKPAAGNSVSRHSKRDNAQRSQRAGSADKANGSGGKTGKTIGLHPRNVHHGRYDMEALVAALPTLASHLTLNPRGEQTINFSDPEAVLCLNRALLQQCYGIQNWTVPEHYLCPPIPGRADYIHYCADLLRKYQLDQRDVTVLDIGTGANLIYPLLAASVYGWQVVGSDIDQQALSNAGQILQANPQLSGGIRLRHQPDPQAILQHIIQPGEHYQLTVCNPPFYQSADEAMAENQRKVRNLERHQQKNNTQPGNNSTAAQSDAVSAGGSSDPWAQAKARVDERNFGGQSNELWCPGGELAFLKRLIRESQNYAGQVDWFTSLVSKQDNVPLLLEYLKRQGAKKTEVVKMAQGQKISRFIAWTF